MINLKLLDNFKTIDLVENTSKLALSESIHFILYQLNVSDLNSGFNTDYETREINRAAEMVQRARLEKYFLKKIPNFKGKIDHFNEGFEDQVALFSFIIDYINKHIDNSYLDWFEQYAWIEDAKNFVKEYGADQVYFTQYLSKLSIIAPERAAVEIYSNLFDETGMDLNNRAAYTFSSFHPEVFRRLYRYFYLNSVDKFQLQKDLNLETFYCINMMFLSTRLGYLQGAGGMFFLESSIPYQLSKINNGLKRLNIPVSVRQFFEMHCQVDEVHSLNWWNHGIKDYLINKQSLLDLMTGIDIAISARNQLWCGLSKRRTI